MEHLTEAKSARLLLIYSRLVRGEVLSKAALSAQYNISEKSVQRDIASLRCFFEEELLGQDASPILDIEVIRIGG